MTRRTDMRYHELVDAISDAENPNVLDYIDDAVQMLKDLWGIWKFQKHAARY